ncbi:MAG: DUF2339 domain-containing protein [Gemmatimonadetes bacterium]|nr:DUF2339 domain-containing protein [Gemmatimonadota bacterium]
MSDEQSGSEKRRIEALEVVVRTLVADLERLRNEVASLRGTPPPALDPVIPATPRDPVVIRPEPLPRAVGPARTSRSQASASGDLEQLVGRYGTVVVATLSILLGLGVFLQWAITRGLLGPEVRVALGAVAALALTALGLWMRARRSARYGNALLAIALAIVHLDAWAAGPGLGIVAPAFALTVAAAASLALAALALREGEEFLFCLGLGGALLAPFVTSTGEGSVGQLLVFGGAVLAAAIVALRDPDWRAARQLLPLFAGWYMTTGVLWRTSEMSANSHFWPAALALVLSLVGLTLGAREVRRGLVKSLLSLLALAILMGDSGVHTPPWTAVAYALFGTVTAHALRRRTAAADEGPDTWYEVVGLPLLLLGSAVLVRGQIDLPQGAWIAGAWAALTAVFLFIDDASHRARHLTVILTAAVVASVALFHDRELARIVAFAFVALAGVFTLERERGPSLLLPILLGLGLATLRAVMLYDHRAHWSYTPFLNDVSLAAAVVVIGYALQSWLVPRTLGAPDVKQGPWSAPETLTALRLLGPVAAFLWARQELAGAFSSDIATFLLISYYAVTGVGTILLGRSRGVSGLRQAGLVLSLYAAVKVVLESSDFDRIGLRVGSYLVVGAFLLGVGYLYRGGAPTVASDA